MRKPLDQRRAGPIGAARIPGGGREARNAAATASAFQTARFQSDVDLSTIPVDMTGAPLAVTGLLKRLDALQKAHNDLMAAMRDVRLLEKQP